MKFNINTICTVKLSSWGKVYLWRYLETVFDAENQRYKVPEAYEEMSKESHAWSLHELCHIFGPYLTMGQTQLPFDSEIDFFVKD